MKYNLPSLALPILFAVTSVHGQHNLWQNTMQFIEDDDPEIAASERDFYNRCSSQLSSAIQYMVKSSEHSAVSAKEYLTKRFHEIYGKLRRESAAAQLAELEGITRPIEELEKCQIRVADDQRRNGIPGFRSIGDKTDTTSSEPSSAPSPQTSQQSPKTITTEDVSECLTADQSPTHQGAFRNKCTYSVIYVMCIVEPSKDAVNSNFACVEGSRPKHLAVVGAQNIQAEAFRGGKGLYWFGCRYTNTANAQQNYDIDLKSVVYTRGEGLKGRCIVTNN